MELIPPRGGPHSGRMEGGTRDQFDSITISVNAVKLSYLLELWRGQTNPFELKKRMSAEGLTCPPHDVGRGEGTIY